MASDNQGVSQGNGRLLFGIVVTIFFALPVATPLVIFLGNHFNQPDILKIWKEAALLLAAAIVLLSGAYKPLMDLRDRKLKVLLWLIIAYSGWTILLGVLNVAIFDQVSLGAFLYSVVLNLRFLAFFVVCWLVTQLAPRLQHIWQKVILLPAAAVVIFGLLQIWVLPHNALEYIGYSPDTIPAYQMVDQHNDYVRAQSTLRGPNPLGAYLIIVVAALLVGLHKRRLPQAALLAGTLVVLFYTYSRSAWLGAAITMAVLIFMAIRSPRLRRNLAIGGVAAVLLLAGLVYAGRDNQFVQKTVFHSDETSLSAQSSNEQRAGALERGAHDVVSEPFGRGPGSAGPASFHNDSQSERISENYFLQIGQETGWVGLALFIAITVQLARLLWARRSHALAKVLLASLAGITVVSLLSHAWTDETLALIWWGLAGIAIARLNPGQSRITPR